MLSVNIYLGLVVYLLLSHYGHIRLGGAEAQPEFSYWGWFSMLFSAGMGIGLLFFSGRTIREFLFRDRFLCLNCPVNSADFHSGN